MARSATRTRWLSMSRSMAESPPECTARVPVFRDGSGRGSVNRVSDIDICQCKSYGLSRPKRGFESRLEPPPLVTIRSFVRLIDERATALQGRDTGAGGFAPYCSEDLQSGITVLTDPEATRMQPTWQSLESTEKRYGSPETSHARAFSPCSTAIGRPGCAPRAP